MGPSTSPASHRPNVTSWPVGQWEEAPALSWGQLVGPAHLTRGVATLTGRQQRGQVCGSPAADSANLPSGVWPQPWSLSAFSPSSSTTPSVFALLQGPFLSLCHSLQFLCALPNTFFSNAMTPKGPYTLSASKTRASGARGGQPTRSPSNSKTLPEGPGRMGTVRGDTENPQGSGLDPSPAAKPWNLQLAMELS